MADDLRVSIYDDDVRIVVEGSIGVNGEDGEDGVGVHQGGLTGQILTKASDIDYDTLWKDPSAGVPNDGTEGQLLSKASSDPYDTVWITLTGYAELDAANVFTEANSFAAIVMPESAPIYMGTAPDGYVMLQYHDGGLAAVNPRWGAALRIYGVGIDDPAAVVNGQVLVIQHDTVDSFFVNTYNSGTSPEARIWIQGWNLGTASDPHLVAWADNVQDIGVLAAAPYKGRIRNIYAGTGLYEAGVALSAKYQLIDTGLTSIAALTGTGLVEATATNVFAMRALGVAAATSVPTRADADARYAQLAAANAFTATQTITLTGALAVPLVLVSTRDDAFSGPLLDLKRESATPAINDLIGAVRFIGRDSLNADKLYAQMDVTILDPVDPSQDAKFGIRTVRAGALSYVAQFGPGVAIGSAVDQGVNTLNSPTLYENAVALASKYAALAAAAFIGAVSFAVSPTAPTPTSGDNTLKLATTAFVTAAVSAAGGGSYQPLDTGLTNLAALTGTGLVEATATDVFAMRALGVGATTSIPTRADGDARWLLQSVYTAADVLAKLLTVDGAGTGLDADLLDGQSSAYYLTYGNLSGTPTLGTAAAKNTGTSGNNVPLLDGANTWSATQAFAAITSTLITSSGNITSDGGSLVVNRAGDAVDAYVYAAADANQSAGYKINVGGVTAATSRWYFGKDVITESGSNAGSNLHLWAYSDTGASVGRVFHVARGTRLVTFDVSPVAPTPTAGDNTTKLATCAFVTAAVAAVGGGSNQPLDATLTALAGLTTGADLVPYFTGTDVASTFTVTSAARTVLDDTTVAVMLATMGGAPLASPTFTGTVNAAGITATGNITTNGGSLIVDRRTDNINATLILQSDNLKRSIINFAKDTDRWYMGRSAESETGANAGSNFEIEALDDSVSSLGIALKITRASRVVDFAVTPTVAGAALSSIYAPVAHTHTLANITDAGTAAAKNTGTSGNTVPLLDAANTWSLAQTINMGDTLPSTILKLISTYDDASFGPTVDITRDSPSPAAGDDIGVIRFMGRDSGNVATAYVTLAAEIIDPTNGSEDGKFWIKTYTNGSTLTPTATFAAGLLLAATAGGDMGVGTVNATALYEAGVALASKYQAAGSYAAAVHTHAIADVTSLQTTLDGKETLGEVAGVNTQTASYTLVLTDKGKVVEMNNASANNLTIPLNSSVAFPINTRIDISQLGAGQTTIVATGGVTIRQRETKLKLAGQYAGASLYKRATDEWVLFGDLSA